MTNISNFRAHWPTNVKPEPQGAKWESFEVVFLLTRLFLLGRSYKSEFDNFISLAGFLFDYVFDWIILKYQQSLKGAPPSRTLISDITMTFSSVGSLLFMHLMNYMLTVGPNSWYKLGTTPCNPQC